MEQECESEGSNINISDVIEVITTDPDFGPEMMDRNRRGLEGPVPCIRIIEQPAPKALRFRYECEGRSAGSIPGVNSTPENKTYPTIKIENYRGRAMVLVACVTKDPPYRVHPHNLVGKEHCKKGVCTVEVDPQTMTASFPNLGIQCVKKKDIEQALTDRENLRIDPFKQGFQHKTQSGMIDLNCVRLCFQAFLEGPGDGQFKRPLHPPIVSDPIYDKKAMSDLIITKLSDCSASVAGGKDIILLCEKVDKDEVKVRFYEEKDNCIVWEGWGDFLPQNVHKQVAIPFTTPPYKSFQVEYPVKVAIQLVLKKDDKITSASVPLPFLLTPLDADRDRKKRKLDPSSQVLYRHMQETENTLRMQNVNVQPDTTAIKLEPYYAKSPHHHSPMSSPPYAGLPNYSPSVYQPPAQPVLQDCFTTMNNMYGQAVQGPFSPRSPLQQPVDIQMTSDVQHIPLHQLEISGLSPQQSIMQQDVLNNLSPMHCDPVQNVLQPTSGLNTPVQINQLSPQPQSMMRQQIPSQPQCNQETDELNTPTGSATGIEDRNMGNAYGHDNEPMSQFTSGDLASILGGLQDSANLTQNASFENNL